MSTRPVGKCVNFRACPKADSREAIPVAARDPNPVCPNCSQPVLVSTPIVNPRRNALVAVGIVAVLLLAGLGATLKHYLTTGSAAQVAAPTTVPTSAVAVAGSPVSTTSPGKVEPAVAGPAPKATRPGKADSAAAGGSLKTTSQGNVKHVGLGANPAAPLPQSRPVTVPVDAPSAYANLLHTADKLDFALYFQRGSGTLDNKASVDLSRLATKLKTGAYRARKVLVAGFADNSGDPGYSKVLSGQRAQTVAAELTSQGVPVAQTFGFGQTAPAGDNATQEGREKNRRVEIFVTH